MSQLIVRSIELYNNDSFEPFFKQEPTSEKNLTVILIRHGESEANALCDYQARQRPSLRDSLLSQKGIDQARSLQDFVSELDIQAVFVSPLRRTLATAANVFESLCFLFGFC